MNYALMINIHNQEFEDIHKKIIAYYQSLVNLCDDEFNIPLRRDLILNK